MDEILALSVLALLATAVFVTLVMPSEPRRRSPKRLPGSTNNIVQRQFLFGSPYQDEKRRRAEEAQKQKLDEEKARGLANEANAALGAALKPHIAELEADGFRIVSQSATEKEPTAATWMTTYEARLTNSGWKFTDYPICGARVEVNRASEPWRVNFSPYLWGGEDGYDYRPRTSDPAEVVQIFLREATKNLEKAGRHLHEYKGRKASASDRLIATIIRLLAFVFAVAVVIAFW